MDNLCSSIFSSNFVLSMRKCNVGAPSFLSLMEFSRWVLKTQHKAQLKKNVHIQLIKLVSPRKEQDHLPFYMLETASED